MKLGTFSISLAVKDLATSKDFYEKLGFEVFAGDMAKNYLILKNGNCALGLFQGMFDNNIMTFNPGWDADCNTLEDFTDVRDLQEQIKARGIKLSSEPEPGTSGPGSITMMDPDGNMVLIDQHV